MLAGDFTNINYPSIRHTLTQGSLDYLDREAFLAYSNVGLRAARLAVFKIWMEKDLFLKINLIVLGNVNYNKKYRRLLGIR